MKEFCAAVVDPLLRYFCCLLWDRILGTSSNNKTAANDAAKWIPAYDEELIRTQTNVHSLLFKEFFEALVRLAHHVYSIQAPELNIFQANYWQRR